MAYQQSKLTPASLITRSPLIASLTWGLISIIGSLIAIPLPGTPIRLILQPTFSYLAGMTLGTRYGFLSQALYIIGILMTPIYQHGFATLLGAKSGYLIGIALCSIFVSKLFEYRNPHNHYYQFILGLIMCHIIGIYLPGITILGLVTGEESMVQLFYKGIAPFIIGDLIKILATVQLYTTLSGRKA